MTPFEVAAYSAAVVSAAALAVSVWRLRRLRGLARQATAHAERSEAARDRSARWAEQATASADRAEAALAKAKRARERAPAPPTR